MKKKFNSQQYTTYGEKLYTFYESKKRMPSYSEAATLFGFKSKDSAYRAIQKLITLGYAEKDHAGKIIPKSSHSKQPSKKIPSPIHLRMLGLVEAGFPTPAEENLLDTVSLDEWIIRRRDSSFMLRVKGDSMKDAGINNGDMVVVERQDNARIGDIVIAEVDGAWTMKYLRKDSKKGFYLEPANEEFENIYPKEDLRIQAVVRAVIRKYD
jgi:SOS regulatory protein LexA